MRRVIANDRPSLIEENRRLHRAMVEGVPVEYRAEDGTIRSDAVRLVDPKDRLNDWLAIAQVTVIENGNNRRPDVVVFLNGLPIGVIEVKKPGAETATLGAAFNPNGAASLRRAGKGGAALRAGVSANAKAFAQDLAPVVVDIQTAGHMSLRAIAAELTARGIQTRRGGAGRGGWEM